MFDKIENKIKGLAVFVMYVGVFGGVAWLLYSGYTLYENRDFLEFESLVDSGMASEYTIKALAAKANILYSILLIISSVISSFLLFGFGELIEHTKVIRQKIELMNKKDDDINNLFDKMKAVQENNNKDN